MTVPLSMIIMGSMLANIKIRELITDKKAYVVSLLRLMVIPAAVMGAVTVISHVVPMTPETKCVIVLMCAMPCGSMNVMYSANYDVAPKFSARAVSLSMVFMLVTLLFWAWAVKAVF